MAGLALCVAAAAALMAAGQGARDTSGRGTDPSSAPPLVAIDAGGEWFSRQGTKPVAPRSDVQLFGRRLQLPRAEEADPAPVPDIPTCRMPMMPADPGIDPKFVMSGPPAPGIVHHMRPMGAPLPCAGPDARSANPRR